jgi:predicted transcriptional regulator YheO
MKHISDERPFFMSLLDFLSRHFGDELEIVLHDMTADPKHTIVDIRNGNITNRKAGDYADKHGFLVVKGQIVNGNIFDEVIYTADGKILKGSTLNIKDEEGNIIGSICFNQDITRLVQYENYLKEQMSFLNQSQNVDMTKAMDSLIQEGIIAAGKPYTSMDKEEKARFFKFLDDRGVFLISKSGPHICKILKISKYTMYNYLNKVRDQENG